MSEQSRANALMEDRICKSPHLVYGVLVFPDITVQICRLDDKATVKLLCHHRMMSVCFMAHAAINYKLKPLRDSLLYSFASSY